MTKAELLESIDAGLLIEARSGLLRLRFTELEAFVSAAHSNVRIKLADMHAIKHNPYSHGTFDWAGFEYTAGKTVELPDGRYWLPIPTIPWAECKFSGGDFTSNDWSTR
jgi:hypothetical protein